MRFLLVTILTVLTIGLTFWNFFPRKKVGPAGLQVFSKPEGAQVFLDGESVGVTPYKNQELKSDEVKLTIGTGSASFTKVVKLTPQVFTIVNREINDNLFLHAGEVLNLEQGSGLLILSTPDDAEVKVDDQTIGRTPVKLGKISPGEHKVVIEKVNFLPRSVQVQIHQNYRLILDVTLATTPQNLAQIFGPTVATQSAKFPKVKILPTPTGFLRVRGEPSFAGSEIAKVNPDEEFQLLEEKLGWIKIRLPTGLEGWVSAQYAKKL